MMRLKAGWLIFILLGSCIFAGKKGEGRKDSPVYPPLAQAEDRPRETYFRPCHPKITSYFDVHQNSSAQLTCGSVEVPVYHQDPSKGKTTLDFVYFPPAEGQDASKPLVITQGGPGGSSIEMVIGFFEEYQKQIEISGGFAFEYRGTDFVNPVWQCAIGGDADTAKDKACQDYLKERVDFKAINTHEIAYDLAYIMDRLHFEKVRFYGVSYGTLVGIYFSRYFPERLESMVLDGVVPYDLDWINGDTNVIAPSLIKEAYNYCKEDSDCEEKSMANPPDVEEIRRMYDEEPVIAKLTNGTNKVVLSGDDVVHEIWESFYSSYLDGLHSAIAFSKRDYSSYRHPEIYEMPYYFIACHEHLKQEKQGDLDLGGKRFEKICEYLLPNGSNYWPRVAVSAASRAVPVLLLSGQFDPITPPADAETVAKEYDIAHQVVVGGAGHGVFNTACAADAFLTFHKDPRIPVSGTCKLRARDLLGLHRFTPEFHKKAPYFTKGANKIFVTKNGGEVGAFRTNLQNYQDLKFRMLRQTLGGAFDGPMEKDADSIRRGPLGKDGKELFAFIGDENIVYFLASEEEVADKKDDFLKAFTN